MNRMTKGILCAVMAAAIMLAAVLTADLLRDRRAVREMSCELAESRDRWEATAARKEELQEELQGVTDALKEAKLTLSESETRAEELRQDIKELEQEIAELKHSEE